MASVAAVLEQRIAQLEAENTQLKQENKEWIALTKETDRRIAALLNEYAKQYALCRHQDGAELISGNS